MTITKRVRMTEGEAERLREIAERDGKTESEVLREGILAYERAAARERAWADLIAMAERDEHASWQKAAGGWRA